MVGFALVPECLGGLRGDRPTPKWRPVTRFCGNEEARQSAALESGPAGGSSEAVIRIKSAHGSKGRDPSGALLCGGKLPCAVPGPITEESGASLHVWQCNRTPQQPVDSTLSLGHAPVELRREWTQCYCVSNHCIRLDSVPDGDACSRLPLWRRSKLFFHTPLSKAGCHSRNRAAIVC